MKFKLSKEDWQKLVAAIITILSLILVGFGLTSCNVTRKITTEAQHIRQGDTTTTIVTKTTETYDARKQSY